MYEHKSQPLASRKLFYARMQRQLLWSIALLAVSLTVGTIGFKIFAHPRHDWFDCLHNTTMLLSGFGPVFVDFPTKGGKLFSSGYALFSGIAFITNVGVLTTPIIHRFFHKLHLDEVK